MHIKRITIHDFKRFSELTVEGLPSTARLVVLVGPNGSGKSSLFDAFRLWAGRNAGTGSPDDPNSQDRVNVEFHEDLPDRTEERRQLFYIRSAYRNQPDFVNSSLSRMGPLLDAPRVARLIDNDTVVGDNYMRIASATVAEVFSGESDDLSVEALRVQTVGPLRSSMARVFDGLNLTGLGHPMENGTFYFEKGSSKDFLYKNLSGG